MKLYAALATLVLTSMTASAANVLSQQAVAKMNPSEQSKVEGNVSFKSTPHGTLITAEFKGLKPGSSHAMHVHEVGKCEKPGFKSAGEHFNPDGSKHGGPAAADRHIGDFGNFTADAKGVVRKEITVKETQLGGSESIVGKALILHAKADDLKTQPTGDSGDRIACGLITSVQ